MTTPLQRAIDSLFILDVFIRKANAFLADDFEPKYDEVVQALQIELKHAVTRERVLEYVQDDENQRLFQVFIDLGARWVEPSTVGGEGEKQVEAKPIVRAQIEATLVAEYEMKDDPGQEALEAFASKNASYHVWPYWREYLSSQCLRMGLPKMVVPAVQFPFNSGSTLTLKKAPKEQEAEQVEVFN